MSSAVLASVQLLAEEADAPRPAQVLQPVEVTFTSNCGGSLAIWSVPLQGGRERDEALAMLTAAEQDPAFTGSGDRVFLAKTLSELRAGR